MGILLKNFTTKLVFCLALAGVSLPTASRSQTYPIDCAILLCLSGGWPASAPCTRARAEFIRRITPWPVEPPLQIWRCPMNASFERNGNTIKERIYNISFHNRISSPWSLPNTWFEMLYASTSIPDQNIKVDRGLRLKKLALHLVQNGADIDISGPEFNFVRSIRVFNVRYARQHLSGRDRNCVSIARVYLGTYGQQGEFHWQGSSINGLPNNHTGLELFGRDCPYVFHRSVFVEWSDYFGNYGFEQVNY